MSIDPRASVDKSARIHKSAIIKEFAVINAQVEIGANTIVDAHATIQGATKIGNNNHIYSFASIGGDPQDMSYLPTQKSKLVIGDNNLIREFCTINRGTEKDQSLTCIGSNNMFMAYVHIAHDCQIGSHVIMANNASLAGHVRLSDWVILSGFVLVRQFSNIGAHSYIGMGCHINKDVSPYIIVSGNPARVRSVNLKGLERRGFTMHSILAIKRAFKAVYRNNRGIALENVLTALENAESNSKEVDYFIQCIRQSKLGIMRNTDEDRVF